MATIITIVGEPISGISLQRKASCLARNAIVYVFPHPVAPKYVPPFPVCSITDFIILCLSSLTAKNCG